MSTWGTGLFSSDGSQDFLEELAELSGGRRLAEVGTVLNALVRDPSVLMRSVFPEVAVTAAGLVALSLDGGDEIRRRQSDLVEERLEEATLDGPAPELAEAALRAMDIVIAPETAWSKGWISADDHREALAEIAVAQQILRSAA